MAAQQLINLRDARTTTCAATQLGFQLRKIGAASDGRIDLLQADIHAVAQGFGGFN